MSGPTLLEIDATQQTLEITNSRDAISIRGRTIETGTPANDEVLTYSSSAGEWIYQTVTENVDDRVAALIRPSATGGLTWTYDDSAGTLVPSNQLINADISGSAAIAVSKLAASTVSYGGVTLTLGGSDATPAFNLADATGYTGDSALVTSGALNSGSVTSGFGAINIGASALTAGAITASSTLSVTGTSAFSSDMVVSASGAHRTITIGDGSSGSYGGMILRAANTQKAWKIVASQTITQALEFIPGTATGNTTFTTPTMSMLAAGMSVTGTLGVTGSTTIGSATANNVLSVKGANSNALVLLKDEDDASQYSLYLSDSGTDFTLSEIGVGTVFTGTNALFAVTGALTAGSGSFTTISGSTSLVLASGATVTGIDNGSLGTSATLLATQGAIKTYVDAQVTAQDLDIITSSGNIDIDLDSESLTLTGGTGLASSASSTTVTFAIDSTVATLSGSQTLTNKTIAGGSNTLSAIANGSLSNSTVAYGGVTLALGASDATPAFNLSDATAYTGDSALVTVGTITSGTWQGSVISGDYIDPTSSPLANTKIWIGDSSGDAREFALSGDATMTAGGDVTVSTAAACTGNAATATLASTVVVVDSTDSTSNIAMFDSATGSLAVKTDAGITYNSSTAALSATTFVGALTGSASGSSGSCTGNAATATVLATARAINGVDFNGSAPITITAAAGTLTGTELKSTVVTSSLTAVSTIATGVWNGTKVASAYLDDDTAHLSGTQTFSGAKTFSAATTLSSTLSVGSTPIEIKDVAFGYGSTYRALTLAGASNTNVALNVNANDVDGAEFSGTGQILVSNRKSFMAPNTAGSNWFPFMRPYDDVIWIGGGSSSGELSGTGLKVTAAGAATFGSTVGVTGSTTMGSATANNVLSLRGANSNALVTLKDAADASQYSIYLSGGGTDFTLSEIGVGAVFTGTNALMDIAGALTVAGALDVTGSMTLQGSSRSIDFNDDNIILSRATDAKLTISSSTATFADDLAVTGAASIGGGTYADSGDLRFATGFIVRSRDAANGQNHNILSENVITGADTLDIGDNASGTWTALKFHASTAAGMTLTGANLAVTGALSKGSGSFRIDHPLPAKTDTHHLVHSFIEGPQADLIYRGTADLSGGSATVDLDEAAGMSAGTWELLCRDPQVWAQNDTGWAQVRGSVGGSTLTVTCEDAASTDSVSWVVVAERCDPHMIETGWTDEDGRVIVEPAKLEKGV